MGTAPSPKMQMVLVAAGDLGLPLRPPRKQARAVQVVVLALGPCRLGGAKVPCLTGAAHVAQVAATLLSGIGCRGACFGWLVFIGFCWE